MVKTFQSWETYEKNSELYIYLFLYKDWHESIWDLLHSLLLLASLFFGYGRIFTVLNIRFLFFGLFTWFQRLSVLYTVAVKTLVLYM